MEIQLKTLMEWAAAMETILFKRYTKMAMLLMMIIIMTITRIHMSMTIIITHKILRKEK
jgi:hypothetical protein